MSQELRSYTLSISSFPQKHQYNICNGLSNQLLYHAASISIAIQTKKEYVLVPDHYITDGAQTTKDDVYPTKSNSIPFGHVFDQGHFQQYIGNISNQHTKVLFVNMHDDSNKDVVIPCAGMQKVKQAEPDLMLSILTNAFRPVEQFQRIIQSMQSKLPPADGGGTCLHHRDGQDWHQHCAQWSTKNRVNCLHNIENESIVDVINHRGSINNNNNNNQYNNNTSSFSWIYYCGDHEPPTELRQVASHVYTQKDQEFATILSELEYQNHRDISALIDFFVCQHIPHFIGNSVSTFSALQIAIRRNQNTFWYNSHNIPLADMLPTFYMPIVYTYTELSQPSGKIALKASITSVLSHMPQNPIHILYHGRNDTDFLSWLQSRMVHIHYHDPEWRRDIERMRRNGNPMKSNLFLHPGNYFGTWQRIDIPLFVSSEYCLLLDSDTIVRRKFTFKDFGSYLTRTIALSAEINKMDKRPWNAGVMLMNLPALRKTHSQFLRYILDHVGNATFPHPAPSDQGAYLGFFSDTAQFLDTKFNFKPYWNQVSLKEYEDSHIIHFHGPKPHDYLKYMLMNSTCDDAIQSLCVRGYQIGFLCQTLQEFALSLNHSEYCNELFGSIGGKHDTDNGTLNTERTCVNALETISQQPNGCHHFSTLIGKSIVKTVDSPPSKLNNAKAETKKYYIPIAYTYTELSENSTKVLLKASITSVLRHMPQNPIHIIYHGNNDTDFLSWLRSRKIQIHNHNPKWREAIEKMELNGNRSISSLFVHPGNYFGMWQRIDVPIFVPRKYCVLLDANTVVKRKFFINDFRSNLPKTISLIAESNTNDKLPRDTGFVLLNLLSLRKTHSMFLRYILEQFNNATHPSLSEKGAYLSFYNDTVQFLDKKYNFKPNWNQSSLVGYDNSHIIHFDGPKPHDYLASMQMNAPCHNTNHFFGARAVELLDTGGYDRVFLCQILQEFAISVNHSEYCNLSFGLIGGEQSISNNNCDSQAKEKLCLQALEAISGCGNSKFSTKRKLKDEDFFSSFDGIAVYKTLFHGSQNQIHMFLPLTFSFMTCLMLFYQIWSRGKKKVRKSKKEKSTTILPPFISGFFNHISPITHKTSKFQSAAAPKQP